MIALIQRVAAASVAVEGRVVGGIGRGLFAFVLAGRGDGRAAARRAHPVVATGEFRAHTRVALVSDGPITLTLRAPPSSAGGAH